MKMQQIALFFMVTVAIGGVGWVFLYPLLSGERAAERRRQSVARSEPTARVSRGAQKSRREQVEESLKDLEVKNNKSKKPPLQTRIHQAGLSLTKQKFMMIAGGFGLFMFLMIFVMGGGLLLALSLGFASAFGLPFWALSFLKKRRENKFLNSFPDSVDVIVRGIKAGLPLLDSIKIIANEAPEPAKTEFQAIVETQTIGIPLGEACGNLTHLRESLQRIKFEQMTIGPVVVTGGHDERMTELVELRQNLLVAFVRTRHRNSSGIALVWARVGHEITNMDDECEILLVHCRDHAAEFLFRFLGIPSVTDSGKLKLLRLSLAEHHRNDHRDGDCQNPYSGLNAKTPDHFSYLPDLSFLTHHQAMQRILP